MSKKILLGLLVLQVFGVTMHAQEVAWDYFYKNYYEYSKAYGITTAVSATFDKYLTAGQFQERQEDRLLNRQSTLKCTYSVNTRPDYMSPKWDIISVTEHALNYTDEIISSVSQTFTNPFSPSGSTRKDKIYLVALPLKSGTRSWTENQNGTKYNCSSEWAYLKDSFSYLGKVIKITKTASSNGLNVVESFYWGKGYGLLWQTVKTDSERTIMKRDDFGTFSEITHEEYTSTIAWRVFYQNREGVTKSILETSPTTYSELENELSKYVVRLHPEKFIYHTGPSKEANGTDIWYWEKSRSEWPSMQLKYTSTVHVSGGVIEPGGCGEISTSSKHVRIKGSRDARDSNKENPPYHWAYDRLHKCIANGSYVIPNEVEPISNKTYYYATEDEITVEESIDCFNLKIKKAKGEYKLIKGDQDIWSLCRQSLDLDSLFAESGKNTPLSVLLERTPLDSLFAESGKNTIIIKILRFTCNGHTMYSLLKQAKVSARDPENVSCELERIKL